MDSARWERIQALFHAGVDLPPDACETFLREACGGDAGLYAEVSAAIQEDQRGASLLDRGVEQAAGRVLGNDPGTLQEIGPYRIIRTLGEGGMGVVFLAERTDLGSVAAIKVLRDAWLSPARRQRFAAEQRMLARLNHPSIARLYDAGTLSDGTPWIVMEYVDGVPLTDDCRDRLATVAERLRRFADVCEAVQHAHRHLVVHRDLKPSNILVTPDGRVKLLDFGIAKEIGPRDAAPDHTRTGARLMTPAYAAPEQVRGEPADVQSDVYSLGVVLYELLTGRLPFDLSTRTPAEADARVTGRDPVKPSLASAHAGAAWADLDVLCLTAMHKDPARRYSSAEALARDVAHYLKGEPLEARPDSFGYRAGKFVRRRWRPLAVAAAVLVAAFGLVGFYTVRLTEARNQAVAEAARTQRIQGLMLSLFNGGDAAAGPSENLRVLTLVDRGVQEAERLEGEPAVQAEMFATLGGIYQKLGDLAKADTLLTAALDARRRLSGPESADTAASLVALGQLRVAQARFDDAERLVRDGLALSRRHGAPGAALTATAATALGQVLVEKGAYQDAVRVLDEAVRLRAGSGDGSEDMAATLRQLVNAHFYAGELDEADVVGHRALALSRRVSGERHPLVAEDLINLGAVQHERGRYADAERFYRDALSINEGWYGKAHTRTASNLTMLGRTLGYEKRYDEAVQCLQRALEIQEAVFGPVHPAVASAVNDLGSIALQQGRLDDAAAAFTRMADIYKRVYSGKHYLIGIAVSNLGSVYVAKKDYRRAEPLFREAIAVFAETQSPSHINVGIGRLKLGRALLRQGHYAEAEPELLAGSDILTAQTSPSVSWLQAAREDLATLYDATGQPGKAARFKAELAAAPR